MSVHLGSLVLSGPPRIVIETLGQALTECYAAWGDGEPEDPDDGPAGSAAAAGGADGAAAVAVQSTITNDEERR